MYIFIIIWYVSMYMWYFDYSLVIFVFRCSVIVVVICCCRYYLFFVKYILNVCCFVFYLLLCVCELFFKIKSNQTEEKCNKKKKTPNKYVLLIYIEEHCTEWAAEQPYNQKVNQELILNLVQSLEFTSYYDWKYILQDGRPRTFTMYRWWCARVLVVVFFSFFLLFFSLGSHALLAFDFNSFSLTLLLDHLHASSLFHTHTYRIFKKKYRMWPYRRRGRTRNRDQQVKRMKHLARERVWMPLSVYVNLCGLAYIYKCKRMCLCLCIIVVDSYALVFNSGIVCMLSSLKLLRRTCCCCCCFCCVHWCFYSLTLSLTRSLLDICWVDWRCVALFYSLYFVRTLIFI